jgi:hypothetical protein
MSLNGIVNALSQHVAFVSYTSSCSSVHSAASHLFILKPPSSSCDDVQCLLGRIPAFRRSSTPSTFTVNHLYPSATLHGVTNQKTSTWIFIAVRTLHLAMFVLLYRFQTKVIMVRFVLNKLVSALLLMVFWKRSNVRNNEKRVFIKEDFRQWLLIGAWNRLIRRLCQLLLLCGL